MWAARIICVVAIFMLLFDRNIALSSLLDEDKQHLEDFMATALPNPSSYNFSSPFCCQWTGVECTMNGGQGRVTGLLLESLGLRGNFTSGTLGSLGALTRLSLYNNSLSGPIPKDVWNLSSLVYLSLSHNRFSGSVPAQVANLGQMKRLDLSGNQLSGSIPVEMGYILNLRYLFLSVNAFTGAIPSQICNCASLVSVDLSSNRLTGSIPEEFSRLLNLAFLNLSKNALKGELPMQMFQMYRISVIDLSHNSLTGSLSNLEGLNSLNTLILSDNKFNGFLPQLMQLKVMRLRNNLLAGSLKKVLSPYLIELDLSENFLHGELPTELSRLTSLQFVDLSSNQLTGNAAIDLTGAVALRHINLADNSFSASLFPVIDGLMLLEYLNLSSTRLVGTIPGSIGNLTNLRVLDLSRNNLNGSIPLSIGNLHSLTYLDFRDNHLTGDVIFLLKLTTLTQLNLSHNNWVGCFPPALVTRFGVEALGETASCKPLPANITMNSEETSRHSPLRLSVLVGIVVGSAVTLCGLLLAMIICRRETNFLAMKGTSKEDKYVSGPFSFQTDSGTWVANVKDPSSVPVVMFEKPLINLTFANLLQATSNFNREAQLTEGGFGPVYRAVLPGDIHVAIKVLIEGRVLTNQEAAAEFGVLSRIKHPNLVPLLGCCLVGDERLAIYEYMENGNLHDWLHDTPMETHLDDWSKDTWDGEESSPFREVMNWVRRHRVATGIARALAFLHHGHSTQLVHRDVKSSNVMFDAEFEPHLANTGLAGLLAVSDDTLFSGGTPGYLPPEYRQPSGKVTARGDVFSFGVVLLELVTGKRPVGDFYQDGFTGNLVAWVRLLLKEKKAYRALDPGLAIRGPMTEMIEALRVGYLCTQELPSKRPTMQQIVGLLKDMEPNMNSP